LVPIRVDEDQLGVGSKFDRTQTAGVNDVKPTWTERLQIFFDMIK
jgi:hypothetical protein